jgi:predicted transcriptional regulator
MPGTSSFIDLTAALVAAYVSNNSVQARDLPILIADIHRALAGISTEHAMFITVSASKPALSVVDSITNGYLICLEDGKSFRSLKRHLRTRHNLSPAAYRAKWHLASDYPMVVPRYSSTRRKVAMDTSFAHKPHVASDSRGSNDACPAPRSSPSIPTGD